MSSELLRRAVAKRTDPTRPDPSQPVTRLRFGRIVSGQATTPATCTVTIEGSAVNIAGVRYPKGYTVVAGDACVLAQVGTNFTVIAVLAA
jgi:hypothetical protein